MPEEIWVRYCVLVRGIDEAYIESLNKYNYVTVWFIFGRNAYIMPQNQCYRLPIVEGNGLQSGHLRNISGDPNQHALIIISRQNTAESSGRL